MSLLPQWGLIPPNPISAAGGLTRSLQKDQGAAEIYIRQGFIGLRQVKKSIDHPHVCGCGFLQSVGLRGK